MGEASRTAARAGRSTAGLLGRPERWLLYGLATMGALLMLIPVYWMVVTSFKAPGDILHYPMQWLPAPWYLGNYARVFEVIPFFLYFFNSLLVAGAVALSNLALCSLAGYSLANFHYPGRDVVFVAIIATMMIPVQLLFIPLFLVVKTLDLTNTYWSLILPAAMNPMAVFLMRQGMLGMPRELAEAARIDGAGELRIFLRIVMPLMTPTLVTLLIFTFTWSWNAFLWPLIVIKSSELFTLPLGLSAFQDLYGIEYGPLMAAMTITVLPMFIAFATLQRYFIKGMALTGLKV
ncbi:MAG: carbohydrate ABC transporter permease [Chloroflexi bacterium]|nr:carbohydrate ABC transporter permease [Chloroflexota bacterium]